MNGVTDVCVHYSSNSHQTLEAIFFVANVDSSHRVAVLPSRETGKRYERHHAARSSFSSLYAGQVGLHPRAFSRMFAHAGPTPGDT